VTRALICENKLPRATEARGLTSKANSQADKSGRYISRRLCIGKLEKDPAAGARAYRGGEKQARDEMLSGLVRMAGRESEGESASRRVKDFLKLSRAGESSAG
jgi:hypothetical protein